MAIQKSMVELRRVRPADLAQIVTDKELVVQNALSLRLLYLPMLVYVGIKS